MQIVIKLSNEEYIKLKDGRISVNTMRKALLDGTVLPEQHGDLIDVDEVLNKMRCEDDDACIEQLIYDAPTILEGTVSE